MLSPSGLITFTSDFGDGWYVGAMKGAALAVHPRAVLVDITHGVSPMNVLEGAFAVAAACGAFPEGTVHLVVVDPGVGTDRRALVIETARFFLVGPDNGVLTLAAPPGARRRAHVIENARYFPPSPSPTFHGRDIFAPVAAHLSLGVDPADLGPPADAPVEIGLPPMGREGGEWIGEVILADTFGNLITNISGDRIPAAAAGARWEAWLEDRRIGPLRRTYGEVGPGEPLALIGSHGFLEIAVSGGSAARVLAGGAGQGGPVLPGIKVRLRAEVP